MNHNGFGQLALGSLFDGIGGFPLAGESSCTYRVLSGIAEYMAKEEENDRQNQPEQSGIS